MRSDLSKPAPGPHLDCLTQDSSAQVTGNTAVVRFQCATKPISASTKSTGFLSCLLPHHVDAGATGKVVLKVSLYPRVCDAPTVQSHPPASCFMYFHRQLRPLQTMRRPVLIAWASGVMRCCLLLRALRVEASAVGAGTGSRNNVYTLQDGFQSPRGPMTCIAAAVLGTTAHFWQARPDLKPCVTAHFAMPIGQVLGALR